MADNAAGILLRVIGSLALLTACGPREQGEALPTQSYGIDRTQALDTVDIVRDAAVGVDGEIWMISASPPYLTVVDTRGHVRVSGGRRGRGPTDFLFPFRFVRASSKASSNGNATFEVLDIGRHQVVSLDSRLTPIRASDLRLIGGSMRADMPRLVATLPFAIHSLEDGYLTVALVKNVSNANDLSAQQVVRIRSGSREVLWENHETLASASNWLRPFPLWASCAGDGLFGVDAEAKHIIHVGMGGRIDSTSLPFNAIRRPVTSADLRVHARVGVINDLLDARIPVVEDTVRAAVERFIARTSILPADSLPAFASILCADDGALWFQSFDLNDSPLGEGRRWWRVKNASATAVILPEAFKAISVVDGKIIGIVKDSIDVARLAFASLRR